MNAKLVNITSMSFLVAISILEGFMNQLITGDGTTLYESRCLFLGGSWFGAKKKAKPQREILSDLSSWKICQTKWLAVHNLAIGISCFSFNFFLEKREKTSKSVKHISICGLHFLIILYYQPVYLPLMIHTRFPLK